MSKVYRSRSLLAVLLILASLVGVVAVNRAYAQGPQAGGVPQALNDLKSALTTAVIDLKGLLTTLQNSVNNISAPGQNNVRFTPPARAATGDFVRCIVVNVSGVTRTIGSQLLNGDGTQLSGIEQSLNPGVVNLVGGAFSADAVVYCKFTAVGGSRTDIRGAMNLSIGSSGTNVSVSAE